MCKCVFMCLCMCVRVCVCVCVYVYVCVAYICMNAVHAFLQHMGVEDSFCLIQLHVYLAILVDI